MIILQVLFAYIANTVKLPKDSLSVVFVSNEFYIKEEIIYNVTLRMKISSI
ncbi:hypothetical protein BC30052_1275 [Bacillus cereus]|nr:hypothetical protein BCJMU62_1242 [Bacillus cereus]BCD04220.1 hypothetical protein BC30052_1275 [Bacillus cereus]